MLSLLVLALVHAALGVIGPHNPPWPPTYNMTLSSLTMTCNSSGWSSPERGAQFGVVRNITLGAISDAAMNLRTRTSKPEGIRLLHSYDWSNAKAQWAMAHPMDCEERLLTQATMTKVHNPSAHVWVYRNLVKALPWFSSVREKLDDPQCAPENQTKCSVFYHDQEQTPEVPTPTAPHPDGSCDKTGDEVHNLRPEKITCAKSRVSGVSHGAMTR
eukprot:gene19480-971_t